MTSFTDDEIISQFIEIYQQIQRNNQVLVIDKNYTIRYVSGKFANSINATPQQLLGQNYLHAVNIPDDIKSSVARSIEHNLSCSHSHEFLNINLNRSPGHQVFQMRYNPLHNPQSNSVIAVVIEGSPLNQHTSLYGFITYLINQKHQLPATFESTTPRDNFLTKREHEIAFLLLFFRAPKKIAEILQNITGTEVSAKTINNIISSKLFIKFAVYNIDALIAKLHELNYQTKIPPTFLLNLHLDLAQANSEPFTN